MNLSIFNFKKIPWGVLTILGLLLLSEVYARSIADSVRTFSDRIILHKMKIVRQDNKDFDALIMGDSRLLGINAKRMSKVFSKRKGKPYSVYNFSFPQADVRAYYLFLSRYLKDHPSPETVYFSVDPESFTGEDNFVREGSSMSTKLHRFCLMFSFKEGLRVYPLKQALHMLIGETERISFLYTYRRMIRDQIEKGLLFEKDFVFKDTLITRNGGVLFGRLNRVLPLKKEDAPAEKKIFVPDEDSLFWLKKFFQLTQQKKINLVYFDVPRQDQEYHETTEAEFYDGYRALIKALADQYENMRIAPPVQSRVTRRMYIDSRHLDGKGFEVYENVLFEVLLP